VSETAPEKTSAGGGGGGGGSTFTRKLGPLPLWAWMGIGLAIGLVYYMWKKDKSSATSATSTGTTAGTTSAGGSVDSSLIPQFVNQTYESTTPAPAPNVTVNNQIPAPAAAATPAATPSPTTISGAPGSYTTSLGTGFDEWTSTGKYSLNTLASSHGMSPQALLAASLSQQNNVGMQAYQKAGNYNAPVPSGVELFFPQADWATK
jgi:hypothetical protein